jgi:ribosome maturation factor RimP
MDLQQKIEEIADPFLKTIDAFIVDIHIGSVEHRKLVQVFVDTDTGITIGQCTDLNRAMGEALELQHVFQDSYVLEVSSPDITKPLKYLRQYQKNIGRIFHVRYRRSGELKELTGTLEGIENENLTFTIKKEETIKVSFQEIVASMEVLPW